MISGVHAILYAADAAKTRAFLRDTLGFRCVDDGDGWLIFALPPGEAGVHPAEKDHAGRHEIFLTCDDVAATVEELKGRGVRITRPILDTGWGLLSAMEVPGLGEISFYQPKHRTTLPRPRRPRRPRAARRPAKAKAKARARAKPSRGRRKGRGR
jgi:catechol 2,3-dioxygenase-like lactoylglutathione lyase family enzyme